MASNILQSAERCISRVRQESDECLLFLSFGKDSVVTLDLVYPRFRRVVCVFMYFVPGLEHIERWRRWAECRYPGIEVLQVPHFSLSYILRSGLYCVPNPKVKLSSLSATVAAMRQRTGIYNVFLGMKKADGMNRRLMLNTYAANDYVNKGMCYPLAEWTQREVLAYMRQRRIPETVRYSLKASSGVGFDRDCLLWLRAHCPGDLDKIFAAFPLSERVLWEADYHEPKLVGPSETEA